MMDMSAFKDVPKLVKPIIAKKAPTKVSEIDQRKKGYKTGKDMIESKAHIKVKKSN